MTQGASSIGPPRLRPILFLLAAAVLGTCTDNATPSGPVGTSIVEFSLAPRLSPDLAPDEAGPISQIRVSAADYPGGNLLEQATFGVQPGAEEWNLTFSVPLPAEGSVQILISFELLSSGSGGGTVEWSGQVGPVTLAAGSRMKVYDLPLVRGPLANLAVTGLTVRAPTTEVREGQSLLLSADLDTSSPVESPTVFWKSLSPAVATVSGTGLVQGVLPGTAEITATSGAAADTAEITVLPSPASISLSP